MTRQQTHEEECGWNANYARTGECLLCGYNPEEEDLDYSAELAPLLDSAVVQHQEATFKKAPFNYCLVNAPFRRVDWRHIRSFKRPHLVFMFISKTYLYRLFVSSSLGLLCLRQQGRGY